ncbi:MAG: hypothetical protein ACO3SO_07965 [Luteolibacter sp.]
MSFDVETIEWSDEVLVLADQLDEKLADGGLEREERAILDVIETVSLLDPEGDGLHDFWHSGLDHQRIINSFDLIGSSAMVDVLNASKWCQSCSESRDDYSETEGEYLASIEQDLHEAMGELSDLLDDFIEEELG